MDIAFLRYGTFLFLLKGFLKNVRILIKGKILCPKSLSLEASVEIIVIFLNFELLRFKKCLMLKFALLLNLAIFFPKKRS